MKQNELTAKVLMLREKGYSFSRIGAELGITKNNAIGRYHRARYFVFPSDIKRRAEIIRRRKERVARVQKATEALRKALARGASKEKAVIRAYLDGVKFKAIASVANLSPSVISYIVNRASS